MINFHFIHNIDTGTQFYLGTESKNKTTWPVPFCHSTSPLVMADYITTLTCSKEDSAYVKP